MPGSVIVGGARTPIGKLAGSLKDFSAMELGGFAIKAALERAGITGDQVDYVIMGHVVQAGTGQITARQAAEASRRCTHRHKTARNSGLWRGERSTRLGPDEARTKTI